MAIINSLRPLPTLTLSLTLSHPVLICNCKNVISISSAESDSDEESSVTEEQQLDDHYALLVKAWEQKVFPIIRRRFRNEAERKDGLEQIRGALQLGE